jgi:hypothetical protein
VANIQVVNNGSLVSSVAFNDALVSAFGNLTYAQRLNLAFNALGNFDYASIVDFQSGGRLQSSVNGSVTTVIMDNYRVDMTGSVSLTGSNLSRYVITNLSTGDSVVAVGDLRYNGAPMYSGTYLLPGSTYSGVSAISGKNIWWVEGTATLLSDYRTLSGNLSSVTSGTMVSGGSGQAAFYGATNQNSISFTYNLYTGAGSYNGTVNSQSTGVAQTSLQQVQTSGTYSSSNYIAVSGISADVNSSASVDLTAGNDTVSLSGAVGSTFSAGAGDDSITSSSGNDTIDGGLGTDTVIYALGQSSYSVTRTNSGYRISSASESDDVSNVEFLKFAGQSYAIASLVDATPPTIAITTITSSLSLGQTALLAFTLSESSTNFTAADVSVSGGSLSNFSGAGTSYTATFTPTSNSTTDGVVSVVSSVFSDAAGNLNADGADSNNRVTLSVNTLQSTTTSGTSANNSFTSTSANETYDGGGGIDTFIFTGTRSQYTLTNQGGGSLRLADTVTGRNGTDSLSNVERLQFSDVSVAFDIDGNAGKVAKILGAIFGPNSVSNKNYVGIGLDLIDDGMSYEALAALAVSAAGKSSSTDICTLLWTNVIGSAPASADIAPFKAMLDSGQMSIGSLAALAADTSFNTTNINLVGLSQTGIEYV